MWSTLALFVILAPSPAPAQTVANPFEGTVTEMRVTDPLWNGALIGAAIGTGLAMWDYLIDPSEPGNAVVFTVAIGLGTAIGAGIDALRGGQALSGPPRQTRRLMISPVLGKDRQAVLVSVRF